jgi:uncharacterized membrane protein
VSTYRLALFLHLLGAFVFVAGAALAAAGFETARRRRAASEIALLLGITRAGALLVVGGGVVLLAAGLWLGHRIGQLGAPWLLVSLALFVLAAVLGGLGGRRPKQARRLAETHGDSGRDAEAAVRRLLDDRPSLWANYASTFLVLVILVLMVWQPGR